MRIVAVGLMTIMVVLVRLADEQGANVIESLFFRLLFGFVAMIAWLWARGTLVQIKTERRSLHLFRAQVGVLAMGFNLWAYTEMPMAEAATISFTVPIFATVLSVFLLAEVVGLRRWTASVIGFIGVLVVVQPGQSPILLKGVIIGLSGATFTALNINLMRMLGRTERSTTMVLWYSVYSIPVVGLAYIFVAQQHNPAVWWLFFGIGVVGTLGQLALSQSLRWAPVSVLVPMDYTHLVWSILIGLVIWDEWPVLSTWVGAAVLVCSGIYVAASEHRR